MLQPCIKISVIDSDLYLNQNVRNIYNVLFDKEKHNLNALCFTVSEWNERIKISVFSKGRPQFGSLGIITPVKKASQLTSVYTTYFL